MKPMKESTFEDIFCVENMITLQDFKMYLGLLVCRLLTLPIGRYSLKTFQLQNTYMIVLQAMDNLVKTKYIIKTTTLVLEPKDGVRPPQKIYKKMFLQPDCFTSFVHGYSPAKFNQGNRINDLYVV